jgi:protein-L-isoaspartate O-methyltransferase
VDNETLRALADPSFEQHFLVEPSKLEILINAANIRALEHVVELGAGAGTVARHIPDHARVTVVELDSRLIAHLHRNLPTAHVIQGDALKVVRDLTFDVLISNLPNAVTEKLLDILDQLQFRIAILAVGEGAQLDRLPRTLQWREITTVSGDDFVPPQHQRSRIVKIAPATDHADDPVPGSP